MSRITLPAKYADLALTIKNAALVIHGAGGLSVTPETAKAVKEAIRVAKHDLMHLKRGLDSAMAAGKQADKMEAARIAALDAENAKLAAEVAADDAARLAKYAAEPAEQVAA